MTFEIAGLGPWNDHDGRWCCGLLCDPGKPCPYGLKLKPKARSRADRHPTRAEDPNPAQTNSEPSSDTSE